MRSTKLNKPPLSFKSPPPPKKKVLEKNKPPWALNRGFTVTKYFGTYNNSSKKDNVHKEEKETGTKISKFRTEKNNNKTKRQTCTDCYHDESITFLH